MKVTDFLTAFDWDNFGKNFSDPPKHIRISWWDKGLHIEVGIKAIRNKRDLKYIFSDEVLEAEIATIDTIFNIITLNIGEGEKL